jgi:hypothetical protein
MTFSSKENFNWFIGIVFSIFKTFFKGLGLKRGPHFWGSFLFVPGQEHEIIIYIDYLLCKNSFIRLLSQAVFQEDKTNRPLAGRPQ